MSTKNYAVSAAVLLLVLIASASALVVNDTQVNTTDGFKMNLVAADSKNPKGTLEIGPLGNMTFTGQVWFDGEGTGDPNTCKLVINGGTCTMSCDGKESVLFPKAYGPVQIWVNAGTLTVHKFQNNIPYKPNGGAIYIGGGNLIVQTGYGDPNIPEYNNPQSNPALWEANGTMKPQSGYTIAYENQGGGAVRIYGVPLLYNPAPENGGSVADLSLPKLHWDTLDVKKCKVWFGQGAATKDDYKTTLTYRGNTGTLNPDGDSVDFALTGLIPAVLPLTSAPFTGTTYSWAVEGYEDVAASEPNLLCVVVFQFTAYARPVVRIEPAPQYLLAGETAVFTAEVESDTALTSWNWYKSTAPSTPIAGTKLDLGNKRYRLTLSVPSVVWASQGSYSCRAINGGGFGNNTVNTSGAALVIKTMLAHWDFENNLLDSAPKTVHTKVYNGTAAVTPSYVASSGVDTKCLVFDGTTQYVTLPNNIPDGFSDFTTGVTFAVWAVMDSGLQRNNVRYIDFAQQNGSTFANSVNFCRLGTTNGLQFRTGNNLTVPNVIQYDQWQHIVLTMGFDGIAKFYVDGALIASGAGSIPQIGTRALCYIGEANESDLGHKGAYFKGKMGDLRVYNYAVSADDVKNLYAEMHGPYCGTRPALDIDQTGSSNCVVDLADLAMFASKWLGCGRWPDTACP